MSSFDWLKELFCCNIKPKYPDPYNFKFKAGYELANSSQFQTNYIRTAKYRWYDFFIKALILQYERMANVYFLFIGVLSSIPAISTVNSSTIWGPICLVLLLSIIREGYQDYQRYKSDQQLNYMMKTLSFQQLQFIQKKWSQIKVGEIVKVLQNQFFPADLILLSSSQPSGNAFIQTASLDGEKSLKIRKAYNQTNKYNCEQILKSFQGEWIGIQPDKDLHKFSSKMKIQNAIIQYEGQKQFLYRGAKLKNTKWIYGMVIYTGKNTKIMMNLNKTHSKISQIEKKVNQVLIYIFAGQIILCLLAAVLSGTQRFAHQKHYYYIDWPRQTIAGQSTLMFLTYFIILSTAIPISLVISIEFVKVFQAYFINSDKLMYSLERKRGVQAKSFSLNQQLGQIHYILTDKTGTLTKNIMQFKIALIGDYVYGDEQLIKKSRILQASKYLLRSKDIQNYLYSQPQNDFIAKIRPRSNSQELDRIQYDTKQKIIQKYFQILSMTHEVLSERTEGGKTNYHGPSPDQLALVNFAKDHKYQFFDSSQSVITIKVNGKAQSFQLLQTFSFTSDRKRMSIIFRDQMGSIRMFIKGADNVIKQRLSSKQQIDLTSIINKCSSVGLRTLLLAQKVISESEYQEFKQKVSKLQGKQKQARYEELISKLETNLNLIGGTAVLDQLQDCVPQTIRDFLKANIKVWMLTGDKLQTAENIAKSCNLIQRQSQIYQLSSTSPRNVQDQILHIKQMFQLQQKLFHCVIIEGIFLSNIIGSQYLEFLLVQVLTRCQAVVFCRLLPLQKAEVVKLIKKYSQKIVLSIGDGQNDVPMIKEANIGIGLFGEEGMGAVQACDYALPQFRMLRRLLLVHGRWNYIRICDMIHYFFYKNIIFTLPRFVFGFYNIFSGQRIFDDVYVALYNAVFTAVPVVVRAVLEQDVNYVFPVLSKKNGELFLQVESQLSQDFIKNAVFNEHPESLNLPPGYQINKYFYKLFPKLYFAGQENTRFNYKTFLYWTIEATLLGIVISVFSLQILTEPAINSHGWNSSVWFVSINLFTGLMIIVTLKLVTHTKYWSYILVVSIIFVSLGLYIAYMWFSNYYAILKTSEYILGTVSVMWNCAQTWFFQLFCICLILVIDGIAVTIEFQYGSYASKMRLAIFEQKTQNKKYLQQQLQLPLSSNRCQDLQINSMTAIQPEKINQSIIKQSRIVSLECEI